MLDVKHWPTVIHERFYKKVKRYDDSTCWWWQGAKSSDGYGAAYTGETTASGRPRLVGAHRLSYMLSNNVPSIARGMDCLHSCDNALCVNPEHLRIDTRKANIRDCYSKGRGRPGTRPGVPRAVLTPADVLTIRKKHASKLFTLGDLSREYRVTRKTVANIVDRKSWKSLDI